MLARPAPAATSSTDAAAARASTATSSRRAARPALIGALRLLARDFARGLVEAHAQEGGMAQPAVGGPFHEGDLSHDLGLYPGCGARNALLGLERGRLADERGEPLGQLAQRRAAEARPD